MYLCIACSCCTFSCINGRGKGNGKGKDCVKSDINLPRSSATFDKIMASRLTKKQHMPEYHTLETDYGEQPLPSCSASEILKEPGP